MNSQASRLMPLRKISPPQRKFQLGTKDTCGADSSGRIAFEDSFKEWLQVGRKVGFAEMYLCQVLTQHGFSGLVRKWQFTSEHFISDHAKSPHIRCLAGRLSEQQFG